MFRTSFFSHYSNSLCLGHCPGPGNKPHELSYKVDLGIYQDVFSDYDFFS